MDSVSRRTKCFDCTKKVGCHGESKRRFGLLRMRMGQVIVAAAAVIALSVVPCAWAVVVTDNFSDLNDTASPAWTHLENEVGSTGQTWDASTGQYHLVAPGNSAGFGVDGYGFVGSNVGPSFTDVRVTADIVDFPNVGIQGSFFAIGARNNGDNSLPSVGVGLPLRGYSYQYESNANNGLGEMVLNLVYGDGLKDLRSQKGPAPNGIEQLLDNTKDYRFVFEVIGNVMHGKVIELDAGGNEVGTVAEQFRNLDVEPVGNIDDDGDNSTPQVPFVPYTSGFSGAYAVGHIFYTDGDVTIDNFKTETAAAGDYNRNGATDGADYVLWRKTLGNAGPTANPPTSFSDMRANGDVTAGEFSQVIDQADYVFWRSKFGTSASGSGLGNGGAVPEPASVLLALLGVASIAGRRWRR